jgi:mRNA interferase MazF
VTPRRGEIWWVRQPVHPSQAGDQSKARRPYLVVSGDPWNMEPRYPRVSLCPLTGIERVTRRYDTDVVLRKRETGLPKDSVVRCVEIYTVFRDVLIERVARISEGTMQQVDRALGIYLSLV